MGPRSRFQLSGCGGADAVETTATRCDSAGAAYRVWTSAGGWGPTGEGLPGRRLTAAMRKEDVGAHVPTESPSPQPTRDTTGQHGSDGPGYTEEASVQTSANTCSQGDRDPFGQPVYRLLRWGAPGPCCLNCAGSKVSSFAVTRLTIIGLYDAILFENLLIYPEYLEGQYNELRRYHERWDCTLYELNINNNDVKI